MTREGPLSWKTMVEDRNKVGGVGDPNTVPGRMDSCEHITKKKPDNTTHSLSKAI